MGFELIIFVFLSTVVRSGIKSFDSCIYHPLDGTCNGTPTCTGKDICSEYKLSFGACSSYTCAQYEAAVKTKSGECTGGVVYLCVDEDDEPKSTPTEKPTTVTIDEPVTNPTEKPTTVTNNVPVMNPTKKPVMNPTKRPTTRNMTTSSSSSSGMDTGVIVGIVIGAVLVLGAIVGVVIYKKSATKL